MGGITKEVVNDVHAFREISKELRVLARSSPVDKYMLTTGLKNEGFTVAITGGVASDSDALK